MLKQFVLKKHLFDYAASSPSPVNPYFWVAGWVWILLTHLFLLYWAFLWTVSQVGVFLSIFYDMICQGPNLDF
jgi:hypothetical protein